MATPEEGREYSHINGIAPKVPTTPGINFQGVTGRGSNFSSDPDKEKPGAATTATGPFALEKKAVNVPGDSTLNATDFARDYPILAEHWGVDLPDRAKRAMDALADLEAWQAEAVAARTLNHAGYPLPPFLGGMDEARFWADMASNTERKAYTLAAYEAMHPADQASFLGHVMGRAAA